MKRLDFLTWKGWLQARVCVFKDQVSNLAPSSENGHSCMAGLHEKLWGRAQWHFKLKNLWRSKFKRKSQSYQESTIYKLRSKSTELGVRTAGFWSSVCHPLSMWLSARPFTSGASVSSFVKWGRQNRSVGPRHWSVDEMRSTLWETLTTLSRKNSVILICKNGVCQESLVCKAPLGIQTCG